jgi:hypothetical protein
MEQKPQLQLDGDMLASALGQRDLQIMSLQAQITSLVQLIQTMEAEKKELAEAQDDSDDQDEADDLVD